MILKHYFIILQHRHSNLFDELRYRPHDKSFGILAFRGLERRDVNRDLVDQVVAQEPEEIVMVGKVDASQENTGWNGAFHQSCLAVFNRGPKIIEESD